MTTVSLISVQISPIVYNTKTLLYPGWCIPKILNPKIYKNMYGDYKSIEILVPEKILAILILDGTIIEVHGAYILDLDIFSESLYRLDKYIALISEMIVEHNRI